jgi:hypothetical protein
MARMSQRTAFIRLTALILVTQIMAARPAQATSYTAPVTGDGQFYIYYGNITGNKGYEGCGYAGFDYGFFDFFETGICWTVGDSDSVFESPVFDGKVVYALDDERSTSLAAGFDNLSGDEDKNGPIIPYFVYTHDFDGVRAHGGYIFERDNESIFLAVDGDIENVCLGADWSEINEGNDWEASVSIWVPLTDIDDNCALYSYYTFSSDKEAGETLTIELSFTTD